MTEVDVGSFIDENAQFLLVAFYVLLVGIPIVRFIVVRYTAKLVSASQTYLETLSQKISEAKIKTRVPKATSLKPKAGLKVAGGGFSARKDKKKSKRGP